MRIVFKLRLWGDVPEPLFEFLYSSFNLLQYLKDGVHRSKKDNILVSYKGPRLVGLIYEYVVIVPNHFYFNV